MSEPEIPDTELIIPKRPKSPTKRGRAVLTPSKGKRGLFSPSLFENATNTFEIVTPAPEYGDNMLKAQSPGLLAFRKLQSRNKTRPTRPTTAVNPSPAQLMPSLITKHPLSSLKEPPKLETEQYERDIEMEVDSISFKEDPIAYFSKRKDGRGHLFIYLIFSGDRKDPFFSPYDLIKVPSSEIGNDYFTMSANGVTHVMPNGNTEEMSLDRWAKESSNFDACRKLKIFSQFLFWKPFKIWKNFVMRQRFENLTDKIMTVSFFNNYAFYQAALEILQTTADDILSRLLLSFQSQKMYPIDEFRKVSESNIEELKNEYNIFLRTVVQRVEQLDIDIRDPQRCVVYDSDFPEIKRRNPNLGQLKVLERKKYYESNRRHEVVKKEIHAFGNFVRLVDYLLLESLAKSCYQCWIAADNNISTDQSSIFEIQVSFSEEGEIVFTPTLKDLLDTIKEALDQSLNALNTLPRVIRAPLIRPHLNESIPSLTMIFDEGPSFSSFIVCNKNIEIIRDHIYDVVIESYNGVYEAAQIFKDFYSIYRTGKTWKPEQYQIERGGRDPPISLKFGFASKVEETEDIVFDSAKEITIKFQKVRDDIDRFRQDEIKMNSFRSCTLRGPLYVDSKTLRSHLSPIPLRVQQGIQKMLEQLVSSKIEKMRNIFKHCSRYLKMDPNSLEQYVDFCSFADRCEELTPLALKEVKLVDELFSIFDEFNIPYKQTLERERNPLHPLYTQFKSDQEAAAATRKYHSQAFMEILEERLIATQTELNGHHDNVTAFPDTIEAADVDAFLPIMQETSIAICKLEPVIETLQYCKKVLDLTTNDFSLFKEVKAGAEFGEKLYEAVGCWKQVSKIIETIPFSSVDIQKFKIDVETLNEDVLDLVKKSKSPKQLLVELQKEIGKVMPVLDSLLMLSNGRMQVHHWNTLFEECGHPNAYYGQIKISELMSLGILKQREKIKEITTTSQGESQLETEFQFISSHWLEVHIPLLQSESEGDDKLMLGNLKTLFQQIADSQVTLEKMLSVPFVTGIRDNVVALSDKLENIAKILDEWLVFQSNWVVLEPLFLLEDIKAILPQQHSKMQMVKRRWISLVKNTKENTELFKVCSFPSLLEMLKENNAAMETITASLNKYIDSRRQDAPRLYFLSNQEIITLLTTSDFTVFNTQIAKMFMHVKFFDSHINEQAILTNVPNSAHFPKVQITGIVGDDGDTLPFTKNVDLNKSIEEWSDELVRNTNASVKDNLASSLARYQSSSMKDWVPTVSTYIAILTLQVSFTREIEECFINAESNARAFLVYEQILQSKIGEISGVMSSPLSPSEMLKLGAISTFLNYQLSQIRPISEKYSSYSQRMFWNSHTRFRFVQQTWSLFIDVGDQTMEHGYEFWGSSIQYVHTPASDRAINNVVKSIMNNKFPMLVGGEDIGKKHLLAHLASMFGRFIYFFPAFQETTSYTISHVMTAAAVNGSWLSFNNIDRMSHYNLTVVYQMIHSMNMLQNAGGSRINIAGKVVELRKSCRVILSGHSEFLTSSAVPPELKSMLKPIAFAAPDCMQIANIKLISSGFKFTKVIAQKIHSCITTILRLFNNISNLSFMSYIFVILNDAHELLIQLMHNKSAEFVNYYDNPKDTEEFVVARSIYTRFAPQITKDQFKTFMEIIWTDFHLFNDFDKFCNHIMNPHIFIIEQAIDFITSAVLEELKPMEDEVPTKYIASKVATLYTMMLKFPCIIITGTPNSGKTLILEMLEKAFIKLAQNADIINRFPGIMPVKIVDVFQESEDFSTMYGYHKEDEQIGLMQMSGHLNTYLTSLAKDEKTHHGILRFNGPMTVHFVQFLQELLSSTLSSKCKMNNLDTLHFDRRFHIIVETESLVNISPACIAQVGVLPLQSEITLHRLFKQVIMHTSFPWESYEIVEDVFNDVAPKMIEFITKEGGFNYNPHTERGQFMLTDRFLRKALILAGDAAEFSRVVFSDDAALKMSLVHSFFLVAASMSDYELIIKLDKWVRNTFNIHVPESWDDFNIPEFFKQQYPKPSLASLRFFKNHLIPLDLTTLYPVNISIKRVFQSTVEDIAVLTPRMIPKLHAMTAILRKHRNMLLYGEQGCGKTAMLRQFFNRQNEFIPIYVPVSPTSTGTTLLQFIRTHTPVVTKEYAMMKGSRTYALIFEDIPAKNLNAIEFIRKILTKKEVTITSKIDSKFADIFPLRNCVIILTASNIEQFSMRILNYVISVKLEMPSDTYIKHTFVQIADSFEIPKDIIDIACSLVDAFNGEVIEFNENQLLQLLPFSDFANVSREEVLRILIRHAMLCVDPQTPDDKEKFKTCIEKVFNGEEFKSIIEELNNGMYYRPKISYTEDLSTVKSEVQVMDEESLKLELEKLLISANSKLQERINLAFFPHVISQYNNIYEALLYPGGNAYLIGAASSGRRSLVRLFAASNNFEFVELIPLNSINSISLDKRRKHLKNMMRDVITGAVAEKRNTIVFARMNEFNIDEINSLMTYMQRIEYTQFFTDKSLKELYSKHLQKETFTDDEALQAHIEIRYILRSRVHIAIATDPNYYIPKFGGIYAIKFLEERADEACMRERFAGQEAIMNVISEAHNYVRELYPNMINSNLLNAVSEVFDYMFSKRLESRKIYLQMAQKGIEFFHSIQERLNGVIEKIEEIKPQLDKMNEEWESVETEYEAKRKEIQEKVSKLDQDEADIKAQISDIQYNIENYTKQANGALDDIQQAKKKVDVMNENDLQVLQLPAENAPLKLKLFMRVVCILCEEEPDYDTTGKALLLNPKLLDIMKEKIVPDDILEEVSYKARSFFGSAGLSQSDLDNVSPPAGTLFAWVNQVIRYLNIKNDARVAQASLETKQNELKGYIETTKPEREMIKQVTESLDNEVKSMAESNNKKSAMQTQYDSICKEREMLELLTSSQETITSRWTTELESPDSLEATTIGDVITFALYTNYVGYLDMGERIEWLEFIQKLLDENGIVFSSRDIEFSCAIKAGLLAPIPGDNIDKSIGYETEHYSQIALTTTRVPLIIDPNNLIYQYIETILKAPNISKLSALSSKLEDGITEAARQGLCILLADVINYNPLLEPLFSFMSKHRTEEEDLTIGSTTVKASPKFRVIMFSPLLDRQSLPLEICSRTMLIDGSVGLFEATQNFILYPFVQVIDPSNAENVASEKLFEVRRQVSIRRYDIQLLQAVNKCENLEGSDLEKILEAKQAIIETITKPPMIQSNIRLTVSIAQEPLDLAYSMWESLSQYVPLIDPSYRFSLPHYVSAVSHGIQASGVRTGKIAPDSIDGLKSSIISYVLKFALPALHMNDALFFLFVSSYLLLVKKNEAKLEEIYDIIGHFRDSLNMKCEMKGGMVPMGSVIENLKTSNLSSIFDLVYRQVSATFGPNFLSNIPVFSYDSFLGPAASMPSLIVSDNQHDPTPLLEHFILMRNRIDSFESYCLSTDSDGITKTVNNVIAAMGKGIWVAVHYNDASEAAGTAIADIFAAILGGHATSNFRLIIIAQTTEYLPIHDIMRCSRVSFGSFPSIRHQMLAIYQHHSSIFRSSMNPKAMKKYAYAATLLYAIIHYRAFFGPVGFVQFTPITEMAIKELIEVLRPAIDEKNQQDIPIRNVRDIIQESIFGGAMMDTFDRRRLRCHVYSIFCPEATEDGFTFVDQNSPEVDTWSIPPDAPITNYTHGIAKLPVFASMDVLMMPREFSSPFRDWALSRWIVKPFLKLSPPEITEDGIKLASSMLSRLPHPLQTRGIPKTPLGLFVIGEAEYVNNVIDLMSYELAEPSEELLEKLSDGVVPDSWKAAFGLSAAFSAEKFVQLIIERASFLLRWITTGRPTVIDCSLITNFKGLINAYTHERALEMGVSVDSLMLDFSFTGIVPRPDVLGLSNISLMCGRWDETASKLTGASPLAMPFQRMPTLVIDMVKRVRREGKVFMCPLFSTLPHPDFCLAGESKRTDGELENLIRYIPMPTDQSDKMLITSATALIAHMPEIFM